MNTAMSRGERIAAGFAVVVLAAGFATGLFSSPTNAIAQSAAKIIAAVGGKPISHQTPSI